MKKTALFTQPDSEQMMKFEEEIAYFFGARNTHRVAEHYLKALTELEKRGLQAGEDALKEAMMSPLRAAYGEVAALPNHGGSLQRSL